MIIFSIAFPLLTKIRDQLHSVKQYGIMEILNTLSTFMVRQAYHESNPFFTIHSEFVEGMCERV